MSMIDMLLAGKVTHRQVAEAYSKMTLDQLRSLPKSEVNKLDETLVGFYPSLIKSKRDDNPE